MYFLCVKFKRKAEEKSKDKHIKHSFPNSNFLPESYLNWNKSQRVLYDFAVVLCIYVNWFVLINVSSFYAVRGFHALRTCRLSAIKRSVYVDIPACSCARHLGKLIVFYFPNMQKSEEVVFTIARVVFETTVH